MMHSSFRLGAVLGLAALGLAAVPAAQAQVTPAVYSGTFTEDDDVVTQTFDVGAGGAWIDLFTTSYGGGTNVDGSTTNAGGFDPVLSLFDPSGYLINVDDYGPNAATDPNTGAALDAEIQEHLIAGTYTVALTEYDNNPMGPTLGDGFAEDGNGNFTGGNGFIDSTGAQRTNHYTLNIGTVNGNAPVPEASTTVSFGLLLALGMGGVVMAAKKKAGSAV